FIRRRSPTQIASLSLHDALPIFRNRRSPTEWSTSGNVVDNGSSKTVAASRKSTPCFLKFSSAFSGSHVNVTESVYRVFARREFQDRKSTRLNSSHVAISYAVCCL